MALKTSAFIGTSSSIESASLSKTADLVTLQNGLHQFSYPREITYSGSKEATLGKFWGIYDNDHLANNLFGAGVIWDSATWTRTDVVSDRRMAATDCFEPDGSQVIQYTDGMIWTGYTETLSATVKCAEYGFSSPFKPGDRITQDTTGGDIVIFPAVGTATAIYSAVSAAAAASAASSAIAAAAYGDPVPYIYLDIPTNTAGTFDQHFIVVSMDHNESQSVWHTMQIELSRFVPTTNPLDTGVSPLYPHLKLWLSGLATWDGMCNTCATLTNVPPYHSITITVSLTSGGNPTYTEAIEFYPGEENDEDGLVTNYTAPVS